MSLSKRITLTIKDYSMTLSGNLNFYVNDCLDLVFEINKWGIDNKKATVNDSKFDLTGITAYLFVENSNLVDSIEATKIEDNEITFKFTNKYTILVGKGRMQIKLVDEDGCELKLPPFNYNIESTINEFADMNPDNESVLVSEDGEVLLTEDGKLLMIPSEFNNPNLVKISDLPVVDSLKYTDDLLVNNDGVTKRVPVSDVKISTEQAAYISKIPEITSQLEQKLNKDGIVTMANIGQDIKEAMTGGSVAVVGKNAVLNENIVDGQVYGEKTDFVVIDDTCNLIDKTRLIPNMRINGGIDGDLYVTNGFYATDYIELLQDTDYYFKNIYEGYYAFYDSAKNFISGKGIASPTDKLIAPFRIPSNAKYGRFTLNSSSQIDISWINKTNSTPSNFSYKLKRTKFNDELKSEIENISKNVSVTINKVDFANIIEYGNKIDRTKIKENTYIKGQSVGEEATATGLYATDYCRLEGNTSYYSYGLYPGYYAFYDINKNYISGKGISTSASDLPNPFTTPSNTCYARFTINDATKLNSCWINIKNTEPSDKDVYMLNDNIYTSRERSLNPTEYNGYEITLFNKGLCIGDSLTAGVFNQGGDLYLTEPKYSYPTFLSKLTGIPMTNKGYGGMDTKQWWNYQYNVDMSGHDFAIIQLGVNDVFHNVTSETATYLAKIIDKIKTENRGIKIFVSTIIPAYNGANNDAMSQIIRDFVASRSDCYLIDMAKYSKTQKGTSYEKGHLTALGYMQLAKEYKSYISYIISQNKADFKFVQFSNTDLEYSL